MLLLSKKEKSVTQGRRSRRRSSRSITGAEPAWSGRLRKKAASRMRSTPRSLRCSSISNALSNASFIVAPCVGLRLPTSGHTILRWRGASKKRGAFYVRVASVAATRPSSLERSGERARHLRGEPEGRGRKDDDRGE